MKSYDSCDNARSMLTIAKGDIYLFVRAESDNGQTSQQVAVCLDMNQAKQIHEQVADYINCKPTKKASFIGFVSDKQTGMPRTANLIDENGCHLLTSRIVTIHTEPYRIEALNTTYFIVEENPTPT